jgi:hypothetical protein
MQVSSLVRCLPFRFLGAETATISIPVANTIGNDIIELTGTVAAPRRASCPAPADQSVA